MVTVLPRIRIAVSCVTWIALSGILWLGADHPPPMRFWLLLLALMGWCALVGANLGRGWVVAAVGAVAALALALARVVEMVLSGEGFRPVGLIGVGVAACAAFAVAGLMEFAARLLSRRDGSGAARAP